MRTHLPTPSARLRLGVAVVAFGLLLTGCGAGSGSGDVDAGGEPVTDETASTTSTTSPATASPADRLPSGFVDARERWTELGLENYSYTFTRSCECPPEDLGPFRVVVIDGVVDRVEQFGTAVDQSGRTIPELFAAVETTVDEGRDVSVSFDALTGHPVTVRLDLEAIEADGGDDITITSFQSADLLRADLASARAQWEAAGVTDYVLTYELQCFCPRNVITSTVRGGEVVEVLDDGVPSDTWPGMRVEDLFDEIEKAIDGPAFSIEVTYDEGFGYPSEYFIDEEQMMADEEYGILVTQFEPAS